MYSLVKSFIVVLFVSLISSCATTSEMSSAGPSKEMMEKADKILLVVNETPEKTYKKFAQHLSDHNFGFENTDDNLLTLKTDLQDYGNAASSYAFSMNVSIRSDSTTMIIVSGNGNMGIGTDYEIHNTNNFFNNIGKSWDKMNEIVSSYPHQEILYKRN